MHRHSLSVVTMHSNDKNGRGCELANFISRTSELLERWKDLTDCHTAEFISACLWDKVVPEELRLELDAADPEQVLALFCERAPHGYDFKRTHTESCRTLDKCHCSVECNSRHCSEDSNDLNHFRQACCCSSSLPNFEHFLMEAHNACKAFSTLVTSPEELFHWLETMPAGDSNSYLAKPHSAIVKIDLAELALPLMTDKKQHEVRAMAAVVSKLADSLGTDSAVVDLGAGKGYLGASIARVGRPVLGLEVDDDNAKAAAHRTNKLLSDKRWKGKYTELFSDKEESNPATDDWLRTATVSVSAETDITQLVSEHFSTPVTHLTLAGLHTCGDLTAAALHLFLRTPAARATCLVGCCYHLLSEPAASVMDSQPGVGFPLSQRLRGFVLGRNARMLAQQSLERSLADMQQVMVSVRGLHWRALLETLLPAAGTGNAHRVGRLAARCATFPEYARQAFAKLAIQDQPSADELAVLANQHESSLRQLRALVLLRLALAPVLERLVLLDRAQLLHEQGISRWFLVQLFAPIVSPRCFALVAIKDPDEHHRRC